MRRPKKAAVLCAGGPAPGFNAVIFGVTEKFRQSGWEIIGYLDGLSSLIKGPPRSIELTSALVTSSREEGGGILGTSRAKPKEDDGTMESVIDALHKEGVTALITIGGDDTVTSANNIAKAYKKKYGTELIVIHVPKTIDNDLPLEEGFATFGYITAVQHGAEELLTLKRDSAVTGDRHFEVVAMGRHSGSLPIGIAEKVRCLALLPEEFPGETQVAMEIIIDILVGGSLKAKALAEMGDSPINDRGAVHVIAEGVLDKIAYYEDLARKHFPMAGKDIWDPHGNIRFSKFPFDILLQFLMGERFGVLGIPEVLKKKGQKLEIFGSKCGFQLRCRPPIKDDWSYCKDLGQKAAEYAIAGSMEGVTRGMVVPSNTATGGYRLMPFDEFFKDGEVEKRVVELDSPTYQDLLQYRLLPEDLDQGDLLEVMAAMTKISSAEFREAMLPAAKIAAQHRLS